MYELEQNKKKIEWFREYSYRAIAEHSNPFVTTAALWSSNGLFSTSPDTDAKKLHTAANNITYRFVSLKIFLKYNFNIIGKTTKEKKKKWKNGLEGEAWNIYTSNLKTVSFYYQLNSSKKNCIFKIYNIYWTIPWMCGVCTRIFFSFFHSYNFIFFNYEIFKLKKVSVTLCGIDIFFIFCIAQIWHS